MPTDWSQMQGWCLDLDNPEPSWRIDGIALGPSVEALRKALAREGCDQRVEIRDLLWFDPVSSHFCWVLPKGVDPNACD